jgi:3'-5' exoribonuclease
VRKLLHDHAAQLQLLPGSVRHYYPFAGGWLEHTLNVTRNCALLADRYIQSFPDLKPPLNRDLVIAGAILHDIGRIRDLEMGPPGQPAQRGVEGELFGHLFLAYDTIRATARDVPNLDAELLELLLHVVISHLDRDEWGSPKRTRIPEALILHYTHQLDARFEIYARRLRKDTSDGPLTERDPILDRVLLKRRAARPTSTENDQPPA